MKDHPYTQSDLKNWNALLFQIQQHKDAINKAQDVFGGYEQHMAGADFLEQQITKMRTTYFPESVAVNNNMA